MYISLPLCRILNVDEFTAVLGHELGHYKGLDTRFSKRFFPIYRGASQAVASIAAGFSSKGSAADFVLLPVFLVLSFFLDCFSATENEISRNRELAADNEAAKAVSSRSMATSLVKIHAYAAIWPVVRNHMKEVIGEGQIITNASLLFANIASRISAADAFRDVSQEGPIHPTDTHPPLSTRLKSLNFGLKDLTAGAAITSPEISANNFVDGADALEGELSEIVQALMMRSGEAQPRTESVPAMA
jgi:Zn-dependent protease with chaperone function